MEHQREAIIDSGEHLLFYNKLNDIKWQGMKNEFEGLQHFDDQNSEKSDPINNKRAY